MTNVAHHSDLRVENLLGEFAEVNALAAKRENVQRNVRAISKFLCMQQIVWPKDITPAFIQKHLTDLTNSGLSPRTLCNHHGPIRSFCQFLLKQGHLDENPCGCVSLPQTEIKRPTVLTDDECSQALAIARKHGIYCQICIALNTGLRGNELRSLAWKDVNFQDGVILIGQSKASHARKVPLNKAALCALDEQQTLTGSYPYVFPGHQKRKDVQPREGPRRRQPKIGITRWCQLLRPLQEAIPAFRRVGPSSGEYGYQLFRQTFATQCIQRGVSLYKLSKWLGHGSVDTTAIYATFAEGYDTDIERITNA